MDHFKGGRPLAKGKEVDDAERLIRERLTRAIDNERNELANTKLDEDDDEDEPEKAA